MQSLEDVFEHAKRASFWKALPINARESIEILTCPSDSFLQLNSGMKKGLIKTVLFLS